RQCTCLLFFCSTRLPRDLHSFPTRRSSDLAWSAGGPLAGPGGAAGWPPRRRGGDPAMADLTALEESASATGRSETLSRLAQGLLDRKSTRLNSRHVAISYAVFCLKKKKTTN